MAMWMRYKATAGGAYTEFLLRPNPTDVDYPDRRDYKVQTTEDGANVIQRPLKDARVRRWIWKGYRPSIAAYESQWTVLRQLEYRYRQQNGLYPIVEIWDGDSGIGGFDALNPDTTRKYTAVRILQVHRKPRTGGGKVYEDSIVEFVIEDNTYGDF